MCVHVCLCVCLCLSPSLWQVSELLEQYLDLYASPTQSFLKKLALFATKDKEKEKVRVEEGKVREVGGESEIGKGRLWEKEKGEKVREGERRSKRRAR